MNKISQKILPNHVAIIPDGNRRWAKEKGLDPWEGHEKGAEKMEELVREALSLEIKHLSLWGSSVDNLTKRPFSEKKALLNIYNRYFKKLLSDKDVYEKQAKINIVGLWRDQFPQKLKKTLEEGMKKTEKHSSYFLNFLLAYGGKEDLLFSLKTILKNALKKNELDFNEEKIQNNLISKDLPNVDLIIRTGVNNDPHNSAGFLMWQTQNSQYYFSKKNFPDFNKEDFREAIEDFAKRQRRMGA